MDERRKQVARIATELIDGLVMPKEKTPMKMEERYEIIKGEWEELDGLMKVLQGHLTMSHQVDKMLIIRDRLKEDIMFLRGGPLPDHLRHRYRMYWAKKRGLTSGTEPSGGVPEAGPGENGEVE